MANELSTAGISIGYAVETTAGTRPSSFTSIPNIKNISDLNPEPSMLDVTDLSDTVWKRAIKGLKEAQIMTLTANFTQAFITAWTTLVSAWSTGKESSKATWFCVTIPGITNKFYFAGEPDTVGLPGAGVDAVYEGDVHIAVNQVEGWSAS